MRSLFDLAVLGSGSLARSICYAMAAMPRSGRVVVIGRSESSIREICVVAAARAQAIGCGWTFEDRTIDVSNRQILWDLLGVLQPRIILQAASLQSFWESETGTSRWAQLLREGGYGVTIALQAALIDRTAAAAAEVAPNAITLNACYPDAVNALLFARGRRIMAGIGNVGILAAAFRHGIAADKVKILAHHFHLASLSLNGSPVSPRIWVDEQEIADPLAAITHLASVKGAEMNHITGATTAAVISAMTTRTTVRSHLPGPLGLPGGYPVIVEDGMVTIDLPIGLGLKEAVTFNEQAARAEGVSVEGRRVTFFGTAREALASVSQDLANGFDIAALDPVIEDFLALRKALRCR